MGRPQRITTHLDHLKLLLIKAVQTTQTNHTTNIQIGLEPPVSSKQTLVSIVKWKTKTKISSKNNNELLE